MQPLHVKQDVTVVCVCGVCMCVCVWYVHVCVHVCVWCVHVCVVWCVLVSNSLAGNNPDTLLLGT